MKNIFVKETPSFALLEGMYKNSGCGTFLHVISIQGLNGLKSSLLCTDSIVQQHDR